MTTYVLSIKEVAEVIDQYGEAEIVPVDYLEGNEPIVNMFFSVYCCKDRQPTQCLRDFYSRKEAVEYVMSLINFLDLMGDDVKFNDF